MTTPEFITRLEPNEIFVFGSNLAGFHGGGAARIAYERFGAEWGVGVGPRNLRAIHRHPAFLCRRVVRHEPLPQLRAIFIF